MKKIPFDLVGGVIYAFFAILLVFFELGPPGLRSILILPLIIILPGYALTAAILPDKEFDGVENLLYWIGLSLGMAAIGGLVLSFTPMGLQRITWVVWLGAIIAVSGVIGIVHRVASARPLGNPPGATFPWMPALLFVVAGLIAWGAFNVSASGARLQWQVIQGTTQLWILPDEQGGPDSIRLGIDNLENRTMRYRLEVVVAGRVIREAPSISMDPGESWEEALSLPVGEFGTGPVQANLYQLNTPEAIQRQMVYRQVVLWREPSVQQ